MAPVILGIDPSLTSTGVAIGADLLTIVPKRAGDARLEEIYDAVLTYSRAADYACIEGLVHRSPAVGALGQVQGIVRLALIRTRTPYAVAPPATVKLYATLNGRADKRAMADAWEQHTGTRVRQYDKVDAAWVREIGARMFDPDQAVPMPAEHVATLHKVQTPRNWKNPVPPPLHTKTRRKARR